VEGIQDLGSRLLPQGEQPSSRQEEIRRREAYSSRPRRSQDPFGGSPLAELERSGGLFGRAGKHLLNFYSNGNGRKLLHYLAYISRILRKANEQSTVFPNHCSDFTMPRGVASIQSKHPDTIGGHYQYSRRQM
jgi:hypothetical protein